MEEHHHHHTHHHHKKDGASIFKQKSLQAIERRKLFEKIAKIGTIALAVVMAVLVLLAYTLG